MAVVFNGDEMSALNAAGLIVCLAGISLHVVHKIKTQPVRAPGRSYEMEVGRNGIREHLINGHIESDADTSVSDEEKSDTEVLFDILNRHDR